MTNTQPTLPGYRKPAAGVTKMPPSIFVIKRYGIPLSWMRAAMLQLWHLEESIKRHPDKLESVESNEVVTSFLLKWNSKYAFEQAAKGYITKDGKQFLVSYHGITRRRMQNYEHVLLSFRCAAPEYELAPMVLIKPYYTIPSDTNSELRED